MRLPPIFQVCVAAMSSCEQSGNKKKIVDKQRKDIVAQFHHCISECELQHDTQFCFSFFTLANALRIAVLFDSHSARLHFTAYALIPGQKLSQGKPDLWIKLDKEAEKIRSVKSKALRSQKCHEESL